ncbi:hypothetical protein C5748_02000 [Phyllobacterium phragmitis]|uniref:Addiction module toxin, HicA family n=1 Tax=Phyllobacterium phragmitis TaxID=2670329 RepID=A0A2S9IZG9_9HYPH|nr:hypothetical protein [Phyllobacterium phragmitis]PRD45931.1 hypothetical protein C5748_02000 [Phyllobacterium phragmitis]
MKREQLLRQLRKLARKEGKFFEIIANRGKGSHIRVTLGDKTTTIKDGELTRTYVSIVLRQLGIE